MFSHIKNKKHQKDFEEKYIHMYNSRKKNHFKTEDAFSLLKVYLR